MAAYSSLFNPPELVVPDTSTADITNIEVVNGTYIVVFENPTTRERLQLINNIVFTNGAANVTLALSVGTDYYWNVKIGADVFDGTGTTT